MGYYVRAFCKSASIPSIDGLEDALRANNPGIHISSSAARDSITWRNAEFTYKEGKDPVYLELDVNHGPSSLAAEECREFIEEIGSLAFSSARARVLNHLRDTKYIVSCQLLGDIDDDGYHLNGELLNYLVGKHQGLIQADGEGFYEGHKIVVELK